MTSASSDRGRITVDRMDSNYEVCPVCTQRYRDPKVLPCFHILCRDCAGGLVIQGRSKAVCPVEICRKDFLIPGNDPENLPDALPVYYKRDLKSFKQKIEGQQSTCKVCVQKKHVSTASAVCKVCHFLCKECVQEHEVQCPDHEIVSFLELSQYDGDLVHHSILKQHRTGSFTQKARCTISNHLREHAHQYCLDCWMFVCPKCTESHSDHTKMEIPQAAEVCKQSLVDKMSNIRVVHKRVAGAAHDVKMAKMSVEDQETDLRSSIDHAFIRVKKVVDRRKQEMITRLSALSMEKKKRLRSQENDLSRLASEFERLEHYIESTLDMSTDYELLQNCKFIQEASHDTLQNGSKAPIQPVETANIALKKSSELHLRDLTIKHLKVYVEQANASSCTASGAGLTKAETDNLARFTIHVVDRNHKLCSCSQNVSATLKCIDNDFSMAAEVTEGSTSKYEVCYSPQFRGDHELSVFVNCDPIPGSPFLVNVVKPVLELGQSQGIMYGVTGPRGIASSKSHSILACEWNGHKIVELDKVGRQIREFGKGEVHHPASIAVAEDGSMFVTDAAGKECCLLKYGEDGSMLKKIGSEGMNVCEFLNPRGVRIRENMEVWICDRDNNRIQIFNLELNFLRALDLSQIDSQLPQKPKPNDVIFKKSGGFYICDFANHCILCFSPTEDYLFRFSGDPNEVLHGPECIAMDANEFLYVTETGNHRVSVFRPTGELLRTFGSLGKNEGELKFPMGILVDKNGSVFVAELLNNRIQMF